MRQRALRSATRWGAAGSLLVMSAQAQPALRADLSKARAHWVSRDLVLWDVRLPPGARVRLHYDPDAGLHLGPSGVSGGTSVPLDHDTRGVPDAIQSRFPHLARYALLRVPHERLTEVPEALRSQLGVSAIDAEDRLLDATSLQIAGALDDLYRYDGPLGVAFEGAAPTFRLWAPTARAVRLHVFKDARDQDAEVQPMLADPATGVWTLTGDPSLYSKFYLYEVQVFVPSSGRVERNLVTDPYSVSLSSNSARSQILDLDDPALKPEAWQRLAKPALEAFEDAVLYELHVRDFSANDASVPEALRGTFKAFSLGESSGMRHLATLARAGITHVHLLPVFDFATVDDERSRWLSPGDLSHHPPDSDRQQAAVAAVAEHDGFNWGYDPWHYTVPEGSYATQPDGAARILEFREMVQALNRAGLRVVMDVVYNHTFAAGQDERSVLDRIVPGYYHRLDADGRVETSSCCPNTASEHAMMQKLVLDSVRTWATAYKIDGFRFDLMGHHMKRDLVELRRMLDGLTSERDGVDGGRIYVYGEGWDFGEVQGGARGINATQRNMAGTGIGTFSDRLRDAARGGGPFTGLQEQGFVTGLFDDPNGVSHGSHAEQEARLLHQMDLIRVGLAADLAAYRFVDRFGRQVAASEVDHRGQPAGYAAAPVEAINYVEAHDNETLFDAIQLKAPAAASLADRVRMQKLAISLVGLAQGIPFFHAGVELLRSKSLDRNSYNSGDWFNRLDFTYASNNWGVGLPPARDNARHWPVMRPLLAATALRPGRAEILSTLAHFGEVLAIRRSSRLFRLRSAEDVQRRLRFHDTGPGQTRSLIVMSLRDDQGALDPERRLIVLLFNASRHSRRFRSHDFAHLSLVLHPLQAASHDPVVRAARFETATGTFLIPARTASVFWA